MCYIVVGNVFIYVFLKNLVYIWITFLSSYSNIDCPLNEDVDMLQTYLKELWGVGCYYIPPLLSLLIFHRLIFPTELSIGWICGNRRVPTLFMILPGYFLGFIGFLRTPYHVVRLINTPLKTKLLCLRYIFWKVVSVYME